MPFKGFQMMKTRGCLFWTAHVPRETQCSLWRRRNQDLRTEAANEHTPSKALLDVSISLVKLGGAFKGRVASHLHWFQGLQGWNYIKEQIFLWGIKVWQKSIKQLAQLRICTTWSAALSDFLPCKYQKAGKNTETNKLNIATLIRHYTCKHSIAERAGFDSALAAPF